jgi:hypothetical protein
VNVTGIGSNAGDLLASVRYSSVNPTWMVTCQYAILAA